MKKLTLPTLAARRLEMTPKEGECGVCGSRTKNRAKKIGGFLCERCAPHETTREEWYEMHPESKPEKEPR